MSTCGKLICPRGRGGSAGTSAFRPLRFCDRHPFAGAHPDQIGLKLGHHSQDVEQEPAYGASRVVAAAAETKHHPFGRQLVGDVPRIGKGAGFTC
jgi:hypothetical protein